MLYFIICFQLLQAMPSSSFFLSRSLSLSAHIHTAFCWHSLICWHRQLLALAKLKAVWQDRSCFARWRGWTALAFVSDSFCWLFINCVNLQCIPGLHWQSFAVLMCATFVPDMVPLGTPAVKHIFSPESGLLKVCKSSTGVNCCSIAPHIHCLDCFIAFLANKK